MDYIELAKALERYYGDTSRPISETREGLERLREEIDTMLETLED